MSDESWWAEVEQRVVRDGVDAFLADPGDAPDPELAGQLRRVLDLEAHRLRTPPSEGRAAFLTQQVISRAHALDAARLERAVLAHFRLERRLGLFALWRTQPFSPALVRTLVGHDAAIVDAAVDRSGYLYSVSADGAVKRWAPGAGLPETVDVGAAPPTALPQRLAVSPDGTVLAVSLTNHTIRLLDLHHGTLAGLGDHGAAVLRLRFLDDDHQLVSSGEQGTLRLWDVDAGRVVRDFAGHRGSVCGLAVSEDGRSVASTGYDHTLRLWDAETGACRQVVDNGDAGFALGVTFAAGDRLVLTCSQHGAVHRYTVEHGRLHDRVLLESGREGSGPGITWSVTALDHARVLVTNDDASVDVWRPEPPASRQPREASLHGHGAAVRVAAVDPGRHLAVTGDDHGRLLVWDTDRADGVAESARGLFFQVQRIAVSSAAGLVVSSANQRMRICARDLDSGAERWWVDDDGVGPMEMWFSPSGRTLHTAEHRTVTHRHADTGEVQWTVEMPGSVACGAGDRAVVVDEEYHPVPHVGINVARYRVTLADTSSGVAQRSVLLPEAHPYPGDAAATPDLGTVVLGASGALTAWDTATGSLTTAPLAPEPGTTRAAFLFAVAVDDEGCHALAVDAVGRGHIWDIRSGSVDVVQADAVQVHAVAGLAGHRAVTAGAGDQVTTVWDLPSTSPVCVVPIDGAAIAVAVDGSSVAVGDSAGNAHLLLLLRGDPTPPPAEAAPG